jgi:hypothetical protein
MILASVLDSCAKLPIVFGNLQKSMYQAAKGNKILSKAWDGFFVNATTHCDLLSPRLVIRQT